MNPLQIIVADMLLGYAKEYAQEEARAGRSIRPDAMANEGLRRTADHLEKAARLLRSGIRTIQDEELAA